jgi:hypothetical protein
MEKREDMDSFVHCFLPSRFFSGKEKRERLMAISNVALKFFIFEMMGENIFHIFTSFSKQYHSNMYLSRDFHSKISASLTGEQIDGMLIVSHGSRITNDEKTVLLCRNFQEIS